MRELRRKLREFALPVLTAFALAIVIQATVAKPYEIPSGSMLPTIQLRDRVIANRLIYRFREPARGDIVVFKPPVASRAACNEVSDVPFVKRVIGLPGDTIAVRNGETLVNGRPFVVPSAVRPDYEYPLDQQGPVRVPPGKLFMLGDNRPSSCDSHLWGFVDRGAVIGQAEVTYWPITRLRFLR